MPLSANFSWESALGEINFLSVSAYFRCTFRFNSVPLHRGLFSLTARINSLSSFLSVFCNFSFSCPCFHKGSNNNNSDNIFILLFNPWDLYYQGYLKNKKAIIIIWQFCFNAAARHLLDDLGRRISENSGEARETSLPKDFDFCAALQCCPSAWQFASY